MSPENTALIIKNACALKINVEIQKRLQEKVEVRHQCRRKILH